MMTVGTDSTWTLNQSRKYGCCWTKICTNTFNTYLFTIRTGQKPQTTLLHVISNGRAETIFTVW